jgi:hypothetical protein
MSDRSPAAARDIGGAGVEDKADCDERRGCRFAETTLAASGRDERRSGGRGRRIRKPCSSRSAMVDDRGERREADEAGGDPHN